MMKQPSRSLVAKDRRKRNVDIDKMREHFDNAEQFAKDNISITKQHAYSLGEMVKWFKRMIEQGFMPEALGRSDELTAGYCDELLEDLKE